MHIVIPGEDGGSASGIPSAREPSQDCFSFLMLRVKEVKIKLSRAKLDFGRCYVERPLYAASSAYGRSPNAY